MSRLRSTKLIVHLEHIGPSNHLVDRAEAQLGHIPTELFGEVVEEVNDVLGLSSKLRAKLRVLRGDTNRAGINYKKRKVKSEIEI